MSNCAVCGVAGDSATLWEDEYGRQLCDVCLSSEENTERMEMCSYNGCEEVSIDHVLCAYHKQHMND